LNGGDRGRADALTCHWGVGKVGKIPSSLLHMLAKNLAAAEADHVIVKTEKGSSSALAKKPFDAQRFAALGETPQCRQHLRDY
jgi:hypothetical protein